jgi:uncharacterized membrane protein
MEFLLTIGGLVGGVAAAVFGFIDWFLAVPRDSRAHRVGLTHLLLNLVAIASFVVALVFRFERGITSPGYAPFALDLVGVGVMLLSAWLGGELVQQHGIGVRPGANVNAPSSLDAGRLVQRPPGPIEPMPV